MPTAVPLCIVDDSADYRSLLEYIFKRNLPDYSASFFADGRIFLENLADMAQLPRLIIMDRHMPTLDGYETLLALKQHPAYKTIPVVMISAQASQKEIYACYQAGVSSFLVKPANFELLTDLIQSVCTYWLTINRTPLNMN